MTKAERQAAKAAKKAAKQTKKGKGGGTTRFSLVLPRVKPPIGQLSGKLAVLLQWGRYGTRV